MISESEEEYVRTDVVRVGARPSTCFTMINEEATAVSTALGVVLLMAVLSGVQNQSC